MRENRIRRLPVVSGGKLVGIVSDRDLKGALPSRATSLDVWELHGLIDKLKVAEIMTKNVVTTTPGATIERVAMIMMEKKIEGLPVLDAKGNLVGIVTEGDVFRALTEVTGVGQKTTRDQPRHPRQAGLDHGGRRPRPRAIAGRSTRFSRRRRRSRTASGSWSCASSSARAASRS